MNDVERERLEIGPRYHSFVYKDSILKKSPVF